MSALIAFIGPELLRAIPPPAFPGNDAGTLILLGLGIISAGVLAAPLLLRGYGLLARSLLAPTGNADLELPGPAADRDPRRHAGHPAAELRRIERDLHDGAQARLVAMGMSWGRRGS